MTAISTRVISRSTCGPRPPLVQLDNQYPSLSARSPDSIRRSAPPARSASSAPPPLSAMGARSPSPPTSRSSGACATSPPRAPDAPRSASASPSNSASPTTPRSRGASLAISACARTSSTPGVTRPSSTSKCSRRAEPRDYAGFKPFGALVDRIAATSNIHVHPLTELTALRGNEGGELEKVRWKNQRTGVENEANVRHVFLFVGADPATEWLRSCDVALDGKGFVKTGAELTLQELVRAGRRDVPRPLETSVPGVFAIGDVRCGSVKRVGGAIGEGAAVVAQLHSYLAELDEQSMGRSSTTPEALL